MNIGWIYLKNILYIFHEYSSNTCNILWICTSICSAAPPPNTHQFINRDIYTLIGDLRAYKIWLQNSHLSKMMGNWIGHLSYLTIRLVCEAGSTHNRHMGPTTLRCTKIVWHITLFFNFLALLWTIIMLLIWNST